MSLLMEALKKAEEAKRKAGEHPAEVPPAPAAVEKSEWALTEDTSFPASTAASPLPSEPFEKETYTPFSSAQKPSTRSPATSSNEPSATAQQAAARNLFAAKQPVKSSNNGLWLFVGLSILAALLIAGYFWWQLRTPSRTLTPPVQGQPIASASVPPSPTSAQTRSPETVPPSPTSQAVGTLPPSSFPTSRPILLPSAAAESPPRETIPASPTPSTATTKAMEAQSSVMPAPKAAYRAAPSEAPRTGGVHLSRTQPVIDPRLERAYDRLQAGSLDEAQQDYEHVLRNDRKNIDALLGLATIAAKKNQSENAQTYYLRALEADPSNPTAQAGVINARGQANADTSESRLKTMLSSQPNSTALLFALGNLYARQARWSEAQQTYFQAYAIEPDNPDFIFNLAISLDHLHQTKLAAQYYRMALSVGEARSVSFDRNQARNRIQELQQ